MRFSQESTASIRAANMGFRHTAYTIALKPSPTPGKVTGTSSDGYTFTASEPLFTGARYWQARHPPVHQVDTLPPLIRRHRIHHRVGRLCAFPSCPYAL